MSTFKLFFLLKEHLVQSAIFLSHHDVTDGAFELSEVNLTSQILQYPCIVLVLDQPFPSFTT